MKRINLLLSIAALVFITACSDSGSGSSSPGSTAPSSSATPDTNDGIRTSELSIPEGFNFATEREVSITLSVANSQSERGFMSLYSEFNESAVDYTSQFILTPMNDQTELKTTVMLPNHVNKIWVEVWYPSALGSEITQSIDIVNNTVNTVL
ncbi:hypothetical protein PVK64_11290 [Aliivibrio sp. S4TY2]|uniref:hypothetical protein n=1 Tax=unclassified Aliivibrio TaxID=2645654 RepID=UPI002378BE7D|nr:MULTISPECIES: hypothetical protein [unclassified Aliivibrio]MDD9156758.1 hypothetical protein [Aliivibrio sp. S4TY2]MDD9160244.1 hypothetical protein [Aliivibrio sp. S4TY1]MDD9164463.1 hypothetical protein [Aliivibrio sp. S4MY2]MDD9168667.1 hypothetical protein [Aliivibrio sp. S4MY4]MDD9184798.1 hypothetical protein [Aliivibrio sp. S4MY3]